MSVCNMEAQGEYRQPHRKLHKGRNFRAWKVSVRPYSANSAVYIHERLLASKNCSVTSLQDSKEYYLPKSIAFSKRHFYTNGVKSFCM